MAYEPRKITLPNGLPGWEWPDGRIHPAVSGGSDDGGDAEDDDANDDADDADESRDGKQSADDVAAMQRALRKANKEAEKYRLQVKQFEDANKSEQEKLTESLSTAEQRATSAELTALRYEVALDKGIPKSVASRLQGSTREELEEDAQSLMEELGATKRPPSFDGGAKDRDASSGGSFLAKAIRDKRSA